MVCENGGLCVQRFVIVLGKGENYVVKVSEYGSEMMEFYHKSV